MICFHRCSNTNTNLTSWKQLNLLVFESVNCRPWAPTLQQFESFPFFLNSTLFAIWQFVLKNQHAWLLRMTSYLRWKADIKQSYHSVNSKMLMHRVKSLLGETLQVKSLFFPSWQLTSLACLAFRVSGIYLVKSQTHEENMPKEKKYL